MMAGAWLSGIFDTPGIDAQMYRQRHLIKALSRPSIP
jgi:hypothetical protein